MTEAETLAFLVGFVQGLSGILVIVGVLLLMVIIIAAALDIRRHK